MTALEQQRDARWHAMIASFAILHCRTAMDEILDGQSIPVAIDRLGRHGIWGAHPWPQQALESVAENALSEAQDRAAQGAPFDTAAAAIGTVRLSQALGFDA